MARTQLVVMGPAGTWQIPLASTGVTVGRGESCDVTLDDENVSRVHARISQDPFGRWIVEDMNSRNGVFVEGQRVKAQALQFGQTVSIRPFSLSLVEEAARESDVNRTIQGSIPVVDMGAEERIVSYRGDQTAIFSPALVHHLNELTTHLLELSRPAELYTEASSCLARTLNTLVAVVRLPCAPNPLPKSLDILALHFGNAATSRARLAASYIHFSKRVLDAARATNSPIMAGGRQSSDDGLQLTVVDEHKPHLVFAAQVNTLGDVVDALYIDIPENESPDSMFDFVEAVARQINFAQKTLFLAELEKQEKALREVNAQLKQKDRIKDEYVSRVTHDMKGHLAAIQNCLYVASDASSSPLSPKQAEFLGRATRRTKQLTDFVKELLTLTQMRLSGQFQMESFSLAKTLSAALAAVENKAQDKSVVVTSDIDTSVGTIVGNEFSITEMITNLLFNAVKYTPNGRTVHLRAATEGESVQIDVVDTGIGIPATEVDHVFEEFFRATNARKSEGDGTGLGLSIVKQIVDRHHGTIGVRSVEGQGSTFTVRLPTAAR
jgi:signal transduction histidine kinase